MKKSLLFLAVILGFSALAVEAQHIRDNFGPEFRKTAALNTYELISLPARVQTLGSPEHTGTVYEYKDGDNWYSVYRQLFGYDNSHLTTWTSQYFWDNEWQNDDRSVMSYQNGRLSEHIWSEWDHAGLQWMPEFKINYAYTEVNGKMVFDKVHTYMWIDNAWVSDSRITFFHENGSFSGILDEKWYMNEWIPYMRGNLTMADGAVQYIEQMWINEEGWVNEQKLNFWEMDNTDLFVNILALLKGEMHQDADGNMLPSNMSMLQWFDQSMKPENMGLLTFTESFWESGEWVEDFRVETQVGVSRRGISTLSTVISINGEIFEDGEWHPEFLLEMYYNEDWTLLTGGAEYEVWDGEFVAYDMEQYIYENDLLHSILFHGLENGEVYDELTLYARSVLSYDGAPVSVDPAPGIPVVVSLDQNYPNPFNPVTQIRYELPAAADVKLDVFNIQGQHVATLVNTTQHAGSHIVAFDASHLASGIYLYRLQASNTVITKKMTLIK